MAVAKFLIANGIAIESQDNSGSTALFATVSHYMNLDYLFGHDSYQVAQILLENRADLLHKNHENVTLIF